MNGTEAINLAPLHGLEDFPSDVKSYEISNNVCIVSNPSFDIPASYKENFRKADLDNLNQCEWALKHTYIADPNIHLGEKEKVSDEMLWLGLLAMWVTRPTGAFFTHFLKFHPRHPMNEVLTLSKHDNFHIHPSYSSNRFDVTDLSDLSIIFSNLMTAFKDEKRPWRAMRFLLTALRIPFYEPRHVTFTTVLECLFSTSSNEIAHKLSERTAWFLEETSQKRLELFKLTKNLYRIRSNIVHGSEPSKKELENSVSLQGKLEYIVHRVARCIFLNSEHVDQFSAKPDQLEKYLENLLFDCHS